MRERKPPAITALPFELVGIEGNGQPRAAQDRADDAIEAVGNNLHIRAPPAAELEKGREAGVDPHGADLLVERLWRRAQQGDLARHAFARGNLSALPGCLDLPPRWIGEVLEQPVRWIVRSNGTVEVDQNTPVWSSFGLHALKAQTDAGSARLIVERPGSREKSGVAIGRNPVPARNVLPCLMRPPWGRLIAALRRDT